MNTFRKVTILFLISLGVFVSSFHCLANWYHYDDYVEFGGDSWEYQSLAVNIVKGHGYFFGGIESFETYKFKPDPSCPASVEDFMDVSKRTIQFYRTPGYPVFVASVYSWFGIHPVYVKIIQTAMMAFVACMLPLIGFIYWKNLGVVSGVVSAFIFIRYFSPNPTIFMTEPLIVFGLLVWLMVFILWEKTASTVWNMMLLGFASGILLLIKPVNMLLPIGVLICFFWKNQFRKLAHVFVFVLCMGFVISLWGIYASIQAGEPVVLSTQGKYSRLLLVGNNEDSILSGAWSPFLFNEKKGDQRYLYNRLDDAQYGVWGKLGVFLYTYRKDIPTLIKNKIQRGFGFRNLYFILALMFLYYVLGYACRAYGIDDGPIPIFPIIFFLNVFLITVVIFGEVRFTQVFCPFFILPAVYCPLYLLKIAPRLIKRVCKARG